jgi:hypothetical protein
MPCRLAADAVLVFHLGFIVFATLGALLLLRWPRLLPLHLAALAWGMWIELSHGECPLTPLEVGLRECAGQGGYSGGFIEHYLLAVIYPEGLMPAHQVLLAALLLLINVLVYAWLGIRRCRSLRTGP